MSQLINFLKNSAGRLELLTGGLNYPPDELLVLNLHSVPAHRLKDLDHLLKFLRRYFEPFHPDSLAEYFGESANKRNRPGVLLTFDDGLANNKAAAGLLEEHGFRGVFFIVPAFIDAADGEAYYRSYIRPDIDFSEDSLPEDRTPMTWGDLGELLARGHKIGSHTLSHRLSADMNPTETEREIVFSKTVIHQKLGIEVDSFCSPNNSLLSVSRRGALLIGQHYKYHFTTLPGIQAGTKNPQMILRRNIEVSWPRGRQSLAMGQWDLRRWKGRLAQMAQLLEPRH